MYRKHRPITDIEYQMRNGLAKRFNVHSDDILHHVPVAQVINIQELKSLKDKEDAKKSSITWVVLDRSEQSDIDQARQMKKENNMRAAIYTSKVIMCVLYDKYASNTAIRLLDKFNVPMSIIDAHENGEAVVTTKNHINDTKNIIKTKNLISDEQHQLASLINEEIEKSENLNIIALQEISMSSVLYNFFDLLKHNNEFDIYRSFCSSSYDENEFFSNIITSEILEKLAEEFDKTGKIRKNTDLIDLFGSAFCDNQYTNSLDDMARKYLFSREDYDIKIVKEVCSKIDQELREEENLFYKLNFDIVIATIPPNSTALLAIEYDGIDHYRNSKKIYNDKIKNRIINKSSLPLLRVGIDHLPPSEFYLPKENIKYQLEIEKRTILNRFILEIIENKFVDNESLESIMDKCNDHDEFLEASFFEDQFKEGMEESHLELYISDTRDKLKYKYGVIMGDITNDIKKINNIERESARVELTKNKKRLRVLETPFIWIEYYNLPDLSRRRTLFVSYMLMYEARSIYDLEDW